MVLSEKGIQLKEKLIKIRDEQDFWGAVLCYCNTDKKKEVLLQLLEDAEKADKPLSVSMIILKAMDLHEDKQI